LSEISIIYLFGHLHLTVNANFKTE
jgi:hypothetical protein